MHRLHTTLFVAGLAVAMGGAAYGQTPKTDTKTPAASAAEKMSGDTEFAQKASMGGQHEVAGAKFAAGKATNAAVKQLANKLVSDHTTANNELAALMKTKHIAPKNGPKPAPEAWRNEKGAAFDRAYLDHVIAEHEKDIAMFEAEAKDGTDAELKAWADKKLPALREHLKMAQDAKSKLSTTTNQ
jgi:putative membrane protein